MALVLDDRVKETSTTTGTGTLNLSGAVSGFQTFVAGVGDGNTTYYAIVNRDEDEWETGLGTVTDATTDTLARTTVIASSNSDSAVDFSAGTKDVFVTLPASKVANLDTNNNLTIGAGSAGVDYTLTFDGADSDGVITWMEDEDYFKFSDDILINSTEKIQFYDTGLYIYSSTDGQLDIVADTEVQIAATTIDINGAVALNGAVTGATNITLSGELDAATLDISGNADIDGTANLDNTDIDGTLAVDGTTISLDATTSLNIDNSNTSNGITIGTATSGVPISIGHTTSEVTVNDNLTVTGTLTLGSGAELTEAELEFLDGITAGTAAASKAMVADANIDITGGRNITISGELDAATLDISGNADIDGTTNLDAVDIDGAVQLDATFTVGADDQGYDVKLFGDTASAYMLWDTSADDLILGGAAGLVVPDSQLTLGSTAVTSTAAEINLIDGGTARGTTAVASGDGILINDGGTMRMTNVDTVSTYFAGHSVGGSNIVTTGALDSGSITSGFGTIDTGSSTITTTGLITGGSLDIDNVLINGTTIGHTDDTDLITVADGLVTVAGEISVTTLDIGGTNVASTAAELNIMDGGTSATSTTLVNADRLVANDNGTMVQVALSDLKTYLTSAGYSQEDPTALAIALG